MDQKDIKALALELMDAVCAHKLAEFKLDTDEFQIAMKTQGAFPVMQNMSASAASTVADSTLSVAEHATETQAEDIPSGIRVEAPLVGVFYAAPSPEEPPYVEVGQKVHKGDTLCVIEAMKTMNEISAPCDGTVNRIYAQNGDMIEYKQLICIIE